MEFQRTTDVSHTPAIEREYERERVPTASAHFAAMIKLLGEIRTHPSLAQRRELIAVALLEAAEVLSSPITESPVISKTFAKMRETDPTLAMAALRTLRKAKVLKETALRRYLSLPAKGRIFPK